MIYDSLLHINEYKSINPHINKALEFLQVTDLSNLELGKHLIDGDKVFALVMTYETHSLLEGRWEAHRKYYDIQYILEGSEKIAISNISDMQVAEPYNQEGDYELFSGAGTFYTLNTNDFIILGPHEVHQPGIINTVTPQRIKKIVVKALIDLT